MGKANPELRIENIIPNSLGKEYSNNFNRYTNVVTPNGGKIHIVAQSNLTDEQIVRARSTLEHFLENYPGSKYGSDKSELANKMSENGAILTLLNGQDDGNNPVEVNGQALFENEIQVEGHPWYINQEYNNHRDKSLLLFRQTYVFFALHLSCLPMDARNSCCQNFGFLQFFQVSFSFS